MLIVKENKITQIESMTNEDSSYPKENAVNKQPKKIAKSTSTESAFIMSPSNVTQIAFINVNADSGNLSVVDHDGTSTVLSDDGVSVTANNIFHSDGTLDFSVFSDGEEFVVYGFSTNDNNNGTFTVSGTPTATDITVVGTPLTVESAGDTVTLVSWATPDIDEAINFSWCKTWTDYFSGNAINIDKYYKNFADDLVSSTIRVSLTGTTPSIGIFYAGRARSYGRSQYGTSKDIRDNSIFRRSVNGSLNQVARTVNIDATVQVTCSNSEALALQDLYKYDNSSYKLFIIKEDDSLQSDLILYGKIEEKPRLIWDLPDRRSYSARITSIGGYES